MTKPINCGTITVKFPKGMLAEVLRLYNETKPGFTAKEYQWGFLLGRIHWVNRSRDVDADGRVPLCYNFLKNFLGCHSGKMLGFLVSYGIFDVKLNGNGNKSYQHGKDCRKACARYRYADKYKDREMEKFQVQKAALVKRVKNKKQEWRANLFKPGNGILISMLTAVHSVKADSAKGEILLKEMRAKGEISWEAMELELDKLEDVCDHEYHFTKDDYGRVHSVFTRLKREVREAVFTIDGEQTVEIDIKSAQPALLYKLLVVEAGSRIKGAPEALEGLTKDLAVYRKALEGDVYEFLRERVNQKFGLNRYVPGRRETHPALNLV